MRKLVFVVISLLFICGCGVDIQKADKVTKEDIISFEYSLPDDNPFDYLEKEELEKFLDKSTGILIISNPDYEFSAYFIKQFNYLLEDYDINEVYYYDFSKLKELSVSIKDKLEIKEDYQIEKPEFYIIKDGKLVKKYDLESFDIEDIDIDENNEFENNINEVYTNIICDLYKDKCDEKKN